MSTVDAVGNVHDQSGQFAGHLRTEGGLAILDRADRLPVCTRCGELLNRDGYVWVDDTGGDSCDSGVHMMAPAEVKPVDALRLGDVIATENGSLRVTTIDQVGRRIVGVDRDGELDGVDFPGDGAVVVHVVPASSDDVITGPDPSGFFITEVEELHENWDRANASGDTGSGRIVAEQISLSRAKRLADVTAAQWPDAQFVVLEPDADGNANLQVTGVRCRDGAVLKQDWSDPRWDALTAEAVDLYGHDTGWLGACAQSGPNWLLSVPDAQQIDSIDLTSARFDIDRHHRSR